MAPSPPSSSCHGDIVIPNADIHPQNRLVVAFQDPVPKNTNADPVDSTPLPSQRIQLLPQEDQHQERIASWLAALIGVGYLLPFTALTQPVGYWKFLFPEFNIEFELLSTFMYTRISFLALIVVFSSSKVNFSARILMGFSCQLLVLLFLPLSYGFLLTSEKANLMAVMGCTVVAGFGTGLIDSVVIAFVSHYPLRIQECYQIGVGFSALVTSLLCNGTKLVFPVDQVVASTSAFFVLNAVMILCCIAGYVKMLEMPITRSYVFHEFGSGVVANGIVNRTKARTKAVALEPDERVALLPKCHINENDPIACASGYASILDYDLEAADGSRTSSSTSSSSDSSPDVSPSASPRTALARPMAETSSASSAFESAADSSIQPAKPTKFSVLRKVFWLDLMISLVFIVSLALWPPLLTAIPSFQFPQLQASGWYSLILLTLFSLCDSTSRFLVPFRLGVTRHNVHWLVLSRFVLIPLFVGITRGLWLTNDFVVVALVVVLGCSNGFLSAVCVLFVSETVTNNGEEQTIAGGFTSVALNIGFVGGASLGLLLERFVVPS